jgi:malate synthase
MAETVTIDGLTIDKGLYDFITDDAMPGTGVEADGFWPAFAAIVHDLAPVNRALLQKRGALQQKIDGFYKAKGGTDYSMNEYKAYLEEIGYLVPEGDDFSVTTENVDPEIASIAGPQLVVPIMNARYALNAANARWGSLYDALYGTDALGDLPQGKGYDRNAARA